MDTAELMTKMAEVAPEHFAFINESTEEVKASPFKTEILMELNGILKEAGLAGRFGNAMAGIGTSVGAGIAYSLAGDMYDALRRGITKNRNYKDMMNQNPDLDEMPAKDVQRAFSSLHRFNPEFAADPTVAGSFVRKQVQLAEFDPQMITNLVSARKNLSDIKKLPIPGRAPWDKPEEKEQRKLQTDKLRQDISGDRVKNRSAALKLEDEELNRAAEDFRGGSSRPPTARMKKYLRER